MENGKRFFIDYSNQFKQDPRLQQLEEVVTETVKSIADDNHKSKEKIHGGLLILIGNFYPIAEGFLEFRDGNPFIDKFYSVPLKTGKESDKKYESELKKFKKNLIEWSSYDGAILIDRNRQILGAEALVKYEELDLEQVDKGYRTRHVAAQAGSSFEQVILSIVLSEEYNTVTTYRGGKKDVTYDPTEKNNGIKVEG